MSYPGILLSVLSSLVHLPFSLSINLKKLHMDFGKGVMNVLGLLLDRQMHNKTKKSARPGNQYYLNLI